jgi:lambda family phage tail tape measure protein
MQDLDTQSASADIAKLSQGIAEASQAGALLGKTLTTAFDQIVFKGKSVSDAFNSIALSLSQAALKAAFQPLQQGIGSIVTGLFSGGGGSAFPFAHGGMLQAGTPIPFANGGVIASPVSFPIANGRTGLAGERGAEAIMPLARGPDGRLGVAASGASSASNITINISATDVESFARSETQIAALLTRAVAHGNRNL